MAKLKETHFLDGHVYLEGAQVSSSTGNTTQLIFGTPSNNHVCISSNNNALIINSTSTTTTNQIVLYLDSPASFPNGISGNCSSATKLATARNIQTNLASTSAASFNGTANITPGVTGTLPLANGGTGATTKAAARTNLGIGTIFGTAYQLTATATGANSWTVESCSAYLIGNQIRIYLNASRSSATGAGNIDNIRICKVTLSGTHASKVGGLYNTTSGNGTGGGVCSLYTNEIDGLTFGIGISATHAAQSTVTTYFQMPCTIAHANF